MNRTVVNATLAGALWLLSAGTAHALCIETPFGQNDVAIVAATCTSLNPANDAAACDMNGLQLDFPTHGQITVLYDPGLIPTTVWLGWTRNGPRTTEEYACKLDPADLVGDGWIHIFSGQPGVAKVFQMFNCRMISVCGP